MSAHRSPNQIEVESAIAYIVIRKLVMDVKNHKAYKLGLINNRFSVIRKATNEDEENALNPLNLLIFKIRNILGSNISRLFKFLYLNNYEDDKYLDSLLVRGVISNRQDISRVIDDLHL